MSIQYILTHAKLLIWVIYTHGSVTVRTITCCRESNFKIDSNILCFAKLNFPCVLQDT